VRCGKCPLSTAKEIVSPVGALLKVSNLKRFLNQFSSGVLSKIHAFNMFTKVRLEIFELQMEK
jgi:hypothetical protein